MSDVSSIPTAGHLLARCAPAPEALLDWLRPRVDLPMLRIIGEADYGDHSVEHVAVLRRIHAEGQVLTPEMTWIPGEVLSLTRWGDLEPPSSKWATRADRTDIMRAFCCTVLLRGAAEPANFNLFLYSGENQTLIQLIASVRALGPEASQAALRFLCWRAARVIDVEEYPFMALSILLLAVVLHRGEADGPWLRELAEWVAAAEAAARLLSLYQGPWLLGLTNFERYHDDWRAMAHVLLAEPATPHPSAAAEALRDIAARLT